MKVYRVTLTGKMPLLMHADNIEWADQMKAYQQLPEAKKDPKGDDRFPGFTWLGGLYHNGRNITLPSDNLMSVFKEGGVMVGAGGKKTFKSQTQSGAMVVEPHWPLLLKGKPVDVRPLLKLKTEGDFHVHQQAALDAGFVLFAKRAKIGMSKHIRVRPRFDNWSATGTLQVWDESLSLEILQLIWSSAGSFKGIGDWRPSSKSPGQYGTFEAVVEEV